MASSRRNITILFFTLVVVMLGFGMVIPVLPFYVDSFGGSGSSMGLLMATYALMQFIFAPVWGSLSDRYGRKPVLIVGVLGNAVAQLLFGLSTSLGMLFVARALAGILSSATLPTAMAFISDSTTDKERSGGMGLIGAAMGVGMILGPGISGMLAKTSLSLPFFLASGLSLCALILVILILPESLPPERREAAGQGRIRGPQFGAMRRALSSPIGLLLGMAFLLTFGLTNFESVFGMYALRRFGYDAGQVGGILMLVGVISVFMQGAMTGRLTRRFGEVRVMRVALLISAIGFGLMLLADSLPGVLFTTGFFIFGNALLNPVTSTLISRRTTVSQGVTMGLNNAFQSLGRMFGPAWAGTILDLDLHLPYLSGALIMLIGFGVSLIWLADRPATVEQSVIPEAARETGTD